MSMFLGECPEMLQVVAPRHLPSPHTFHPLSHSSQLGFSAAICRGPFHSLEEGIATSSSTQWEGSGPGISPSLHQLCHLPALWPQQVPSLLHFIVAVATPHRAIRRFTHPGMPLFPQTHPTAALSRRWWVRTGFRHTEAWDPFSPCSLTPRQGGI